MWFSRYIRLISPPAISVHNLLCAQMIGGCSSTLYNLVPTSYFFKISGTLLLSHAVSSIVPSADRVLTVVFGMGTGVSHGRIGTRIFIGSLKPEQYIKPLLLLP